MALPLPSLVCSGAFQTRDDNELTGSLATNLADTNLFSSMILTPVSTAVKAVQNFVSKPELSGIIAEISGDDFTFRPHPEYVDAMTKSNLDMFGKLGYA